MGQNLTPEELDVVRQIIAARNPTPDAGSPESYGVPQAAPPTPDPYAAQASKYKAQADTLDQQAATPYPQPKGVGESIVAGLRNGMESFGRLGAPNGTEGQEALRQKNFADENKSRVDQAKALRGQAQDQQELGQRTAYQGAELQNQKDQLDQTKKFQGDEIANQQATEKRLQQTADNPVGNDVGQGVTRVFTDPHTGMQVPGTSIEGTEKPAPPGKPWVYKELVEKGKNEVWALNPDTGEKDHKVGDAKPNAPVGGASGGMQIVQGTDPVTGKAAYYRVKVSGGEGPVQINGQTIENATEGNANARAGSTATVDLASAERMLNTMQGTLDRLNSGKSQAPGADDMVLLSNHLAMTFGGVKGARTGKDLIEAHLKARSLSGTLEAAAERVLNGGQLTPEQRTEFVELAKRNVDSLRQKRSDLNDYFSGGAATSPTAPAAPGGGWTVKR